MPPTTTMARGLSSSEGVALWRSSCYFWIRWWFPRQYAARHKTHDDDSAAHEASLRRAIHAVCRRLLIRMKKSTVGFKRCRRHCMRKYARAYACRSMGYAQLVISTLLPLSTYGSPCEYNSNAGLQQRHQGALWGRRGDVPIAQPLNAWAGD